MGNYCEPALYFNMEDIGRQIVSNEMKVYCLTEICR